jgi:hypothetical protein
MTKEENEKWESLMSLSKRCLRKGWALAAMVYLAEARKVGRSKKQEDQA